MPTPLDAIRTDTTIDSYKVGNLLFDPGYRETRIRVASILSNDRIFDKSLRPHLNHRQLLHLSLRIFKRLLELRDAHGWSDLEFTLACRLQDESLPTSLHDAAFVPVIASQGTQEQQAYWLPRCKRYEVIGCYAQTELAHGSNVQELETAARFDVTSGEFVISSPRLESTKWWIGGLGVVANHAIVQAVLYLPLPSNPLEYKSYGPHLFIVPVRSLRTHEPLPGITIGDIGPKAYGGFGMVDNGYVQFREVRIPRENMLMRHAQVTLTGEYVRPAHDKLSFGSMVALRAGIPVNLGWSLARAVTIALRYCIHRRQFATTPGGPEQPVITYASVKHRLYPLLASSYAYIIAGRELWAMYQKMLEEVVQRGNVESLAEMHSLSTALKVKSSTDCVKGLEEARKCMGGHGYSHMGGIGPLFANATASQTYEGDNYVISQQTTRSLLKHVSALRSSSSSPTSLTSSRSSRSSSSSRSSASSRSSSSSAPTEHHLPPSSSYLLNTLLAPAQFYTQRSNVNTSGDWYSPTHQLSALEHRAAYLVLELSTSLPSTSTPQNWSLHTHTTHRIASAHADVFVATTFRKCVTRASSSNHLPDDCAYALCLLCDIFCLSTLVAGLPELFESGFINATQARLLRRALDEALLVRMDVGSAVSLTDAFAFTRFEMAGSILGREDGRMYEGMWKTVREGESGREREFLEECLEITGHSRRRRGSAKL
ncbi:putative acyl-CoA oxidase [Tuber indicum]|nr:putative acyl-CoA oxidase [Tuber indicum]